MAPSQRALTKIVAEIWHGTGAYGKMTLMYVWSKPNKSEILRSGPFWEISHSIFQVEISLNSTKIGPKSILSPFFDFYIIWCDKYNGMWFGNMLSVPRNALTLKKKWKMGEIWRFYEFLIWSTRLKDWVTALKMLEWGFQNLFHVVANIKTEILSTESGQKVNLGLTGELPKFFWPVRKIKHFGNIFQIIITLVNIVQFWWSWTLNGGSWGQEIDWRGSTCRNRLMNIRIHLRTQNWGLRRPQKG